MTTVEQPNTVNCEWFEQDDIKGKGVSLNMVFNLNPHLRPQNFKPQNIKSEADNLSRKSVMISSGRLVAQNYVPFSPFFSRQKKENKFPAMAVRREPPSISSRSESRLPTAKTPKKDHERELEDLMEEVTLEENTEEDSCLDMLATQNAEQFTPQMLAITKAQVQSPFRNIF